MTLSELENFFKKEKHLPEIASASEMETNGVELGKLNSKLLQKIEELTLYIIDQNKKIDINQKEQSTKNKKFEEEIILLKSKIK